MGASRQQGLRLRLGSDGPIVTIGAPPSGEPLLCRLDRRRGLWVIPAPPPLGPDAASDGTEEGSDEKISDEPADARDDVSSRSAGVLLVPPSAEHADTHPDARTQVFVRERHDKGALRVTWDREAVAAEGFTDAKPGSATITKATAGVVRLQYRNGTLPIAVVPRHLLQGGALDAANVRAAMGRLYAMVADLARDVDEQDYAPARQQPTEAPGTYIDSGAPTGPSAQGASGARAEPPSVYQSFRRLDRLLGPGGVEAAWQALMADPVVLLKNTYPVEPMARSRAPVVSGNRGPWTLPQGWSPYRPDGDVRSRVVVRTGDTPPNRLAVGLARRVVDELAGLDRQFRAKYPSANGSWGPFEHRRRAMRDAAQAVLASPAFAEVDRSAPVALDSPSLQLNARCRPLLQAWARLDRPLRNPGDLPLDDVMLAPLAHTHELYERWCFVALCHAAEKANARVVRGAGGMRGVLYRAFEARHTSGTRRIHVVASARSDASKQSLSGVFLSDIRAGAPVDARGAAWCDLVRSWSAPTLPDGLIVVEDKEPSAAARTVSSCVLAWDAKYRKLPAARWQSGLLYQAHAFRDCLRVRGFWNDGGDRDWRAAQPVPWSIVLHPGLSSKQVPGVAYAWEPNWWLHAEVKGASMDAVRTGSAGVAILSAAPTSERGTAAQAQDLQQLVRNLLEAESRS